MTYYEEIIGNEPPQPLSTRQWRYAEDSVRDAYLLLSNGKAAYDAAITWFTILVSQGDERYATTVAVGMGQPHESEHTAFGSVTLAYLSLMTVGRTPSSARYAGDSLPRGGTVRGHGETLAYCGPDPEVCEAAALLLAVRLGSLSLDEATSLAQAGDNLLFLGAVKTEAPEYFARLP